MYELDVREFGNSRADTIEAVRGTLRNADPIEGASFERISMPSGGGTTFKRDSAGGAVHAETLTGVIVLNESARVYFQPGTAARKSSAVVFVSR